MRTLARTLLAAIATLVAAGLSTPAAVAAPAPEPPPVTQVVNGRPATENYPFMVYLSGCTGSLPALANAVMDALRPLGIKHLDMPLTSAKLWHAIHAARKGNH